MRGTTLIPALLAVLALAAPAATQEPPPPDTAADTVIEQRPSPRAAFIRSLLVPGLGQAMIGAHKRSAFFIALRGSSIYMLVRSIVRLGDARDTDRRLTGVATDSLLALMAEDTALARQLEDPLAFEDAVAEHPGVARARDLVETRQRHRQDWIVYLLFFTFLDAVDAYVAAHLADYPVDLTAAPRSDGSTSLSVRIPVGRRR